MFYSTQPSWKRGLIHSSTKPGEGNIKGTPRSFEMCFLLLPWDLSALKNVCRPGWAVSCGPLGETVWDHFGPRNRTLRGRENLRRGWIPRARKESHKTISNGDGTTGEITSKKVTGVSKRESQANHLWGPDTVNRPSQGSNPHSLTPASSFHYPWAPLRSELTAHEPQGSYRRRKLGWEGSRPLSTAQRSPKLGDES